MSDNSSTPPSDSFASIDGGVGTVTAWKRPEIVIAAPSGIGLFTPASTIISAGSNFTASAGQDISHVAGGNHATAVQDGVVLFTFGKATNPDKPNQETGIKLHAASGSAHVQAQSGAVKLTANKAVDVTSTNGMVQVTSPLQILLAAAGAALDIQSGSITINAPGMVLFKAGMKILDGAGSASQSLNLMKPAELKGCFQSAQQAASAQAATADVG